MLPDDSTGRGMPVDDELHKRTIKMADICGICKRSRRVDDPMGYIRVHEDDLKAAHGIEELMTPGAYQACRDCIKTLKPIIATRLRRTHAIHDSGVKLYRDKDGAIGFDPTGEPVMILGPDQPIAINQLL